MLEGTGYCIQKLGVGCATGIEYATPNNVAVVEAWGNLQKGLESQRQGVLVFIGHGERRGNVGHLCLELAAREYIRPEFDLHRDLSLSDEPLLSLIAICCHGGPPSPQVKSVVMIRSALAAAATQAHQNTSICLPFSFVIVACHAAKLA